MPGPAPTPRDILKLRGSKRTNSRNVAPAFATGAPECPRSLTGEAKAEWERIVPQLLAGGILATVDASMLVVYCETWAQFVEASKKVRTEGEVVTGAKGNPVISPWVRIKNTAADRLLKLCQQFGITPASRTRVSPMTQDPTDEFESFLNG